MRVLLTLRSEGGGRLVILRLQRKKPTNSLVRVEQKW